MLRALFQRLQQGLAASELFALATVVDGSGQGSQMLIWPGGESLGEVGAPDLNQRVLSLAEQALAEMASRRQSLDHDVRLADSLFEPRTILSFAVLAGILTLAVYMFVSSRKDTTG